MNPKLEEGPTAQYLNKISNGNAGSIKFGTGNVNPVMHIDIHREAVAVYYQPLESADRGGIFRIDEAFVAIVPEIKAHIRYMRDHHQKERKDVNIDIRELEWAELEDYIKEMINEDFIVE